MEIESVFQKLKCGFGPKGITVNYAQRKTASRKRNMN